MLKRGGQVYVSFSGGKDSTVLLHLVRRIYPDVKAVYSDTGLEYPEIREFVKTFDNVDFIYPVKWNKHTKQYERTNFRKVIEEDGYPVISKEVSQIIEEARRNKDTGKYTYRIEKLNGTALDKNGNLSLFNCSQWKYLMDAPFKISSKCCDRMKKTPAHKYEKETGLHPYIGTMTTESRLRKQQWLRHGCNITEGNKLMSKPLSFWTEQDVLEYIVKNNVNYCSKVYKEIKQDKNGKYYTTGCSRTGCMWCLLGVHLENNPNRFERIKETHNNIYEYCMKSCEDNGMGIKNVIDYLNTGLNKKIEY